VRIARAATGRETVVATSYHGWHDWSAYGYYGVSARELGIPAGIKETTRFVGGADPEILKSMLGDDCACVVLCPNVWKRPDLAGVMKACRRRGILVIFDEVTSGIRTGLRATAGELGLWPDLLCLSKGLANGLPLGAILGLRRLLDRATEVRFSNAHSSECLAVAAALACEDLLARTEDWPTWRDRANVMMRAITDRITAIGLADSLYLDGTHAAFCIRTRGVDDFWSDPFRTHLITCLAGDGIYSKGYLVFSDAHRPAELDLVQHSVLSALEATA
jgi:glutamate-1-semialdehyde 2,1-aminomutase